MDMLIPSSAATPYAFHCIWINHELSWELSTYIGIRYGANLFGNSLRMDEHTTRMVTIKLIKVCVELKYDIKFPNYALINLRTRLDAVKYEYKWKHALCSKAIPTRCGNPLVWKYLSTDLHTRVLFCFQSM